MKLRAGLVIALLITAAMVIALPSCARGTPTTSATEPPVSAPGTAQGGDAQATQTYGATGTISEVKDSTLTLTSPRNVTTTVIFNSSSTVVTMMVTGSLADLHIGDSLSGPSATDPSGNLVAISITAVPAGLAQFTRGFGAPTTTRTPGNILTPGGTATPPSFTGTPPTTTRTPPSGTLGRGISGTLTQIDGDTLTLTTEEGETKLMVTDKTIYLVTRAGTSSDLKTGQNITAFGTRGADGAVTAASISIQPQGSSSFVFPGANTPGTFETTPAATTTPAVTTLPDAIAAYSDAKGTDVLSSVDFGSLSAGGSGKLTVYLVDLGSAAVTVTAAAAGLPNSLTVSGGPLTLAAGTTSTGTAKVFQMVITLAAAADAVAGDYDFTLKLNGLNIPARVSVTGTT